MNDFELLGMLAILKENLPNLEWLILDKANKIYASIEWGDPPIHNIYISITESEDFENEVEANIYFAYLIEKWEGDKTYVATCLKDWLCGLSSVLNKIV
jgi:hypothetical protein